MAIQAELGIKREVAAELQEERSEVPVHGVDVVVVHHRAAPHDPRVRPTRRRAPAALGAEHRGLLLRLADKHDPFIPPKLPQMFGHHRVLALPRTKLHERNPMAAYKVLQFRHERPRHRAH